MEMEELRMGEPSSTPVVDTTEFERESVSAVSDVDIGGKGGMGGALETTEEIAEVWFSGKETENKKAVVDKLVGVEEEEVEGTAEEKAAEALEEGHELEMVDLNIQGVQMSNSGNSKEAERSGEESEAILGIEDTPVTESLILAPSNPRDTNAMATTETIEAQESTPSSKMITLPIDPPMTPRHQELGEKEEDIETPSPNLSLPSRKEIRIEVPALISSNAASTVGDEEGVHRRRKKAEEIPDSDAISEGDSPVSVGVGVGVGIGTDDEGERRGQNDSDQSVEEVEDKSISAMRADETGAPTEESLDAMEVDTKGVAVHEAVVDEGKVDEKDTLPSSPSSQDEEHQLQPSKPPEKRKRSRPASLIIPLPTDETPEAVEITNPSVALPDPITKPLEADEKNAPSPIKPSPELQFEPSRPSERRKRGRPANSEIPILTQRQEENNEEESEAKPTVGEKKRRGRPSGSRNKRKGSARSTASIGDDNVPSEEMEVSEPASLTGITESRDTPMADDEKAEDPPVAMEVLSSKEKRKGKDEQNHNIEIEMARKERFSSSSNSIKTDTEKDEEKDNKARSGQGKGQSKDVLMVELKAMKIVCFPLSLSALLYPLPVPMSSAFHSLSP